MGKKLKDIVKKINKAWNETTLATGDVIAECERFSIGSLSGDFALYGGLPIGHLVVFAGVEHSGKSLMTCLSMAQYQQKYPDKCCIYVDAENTLNGQISFFAKTTGLIIDDENRFLRYDCAGKAAEEIFDDLVELQEADEIGMIVIDSAPALISRQDIDTPVSKDNGMRSSIAKSLGHFIQRMIPQLARKQNSLIIINHVRESGKTFTGATIYTEPCGYALKFYPGLKVRFGTRTFTKGDKFDLPQSKAEESDGFRVKFSITKSRLGRLDRGGGFVTFRYDTGVDRITDCLEVAIKFGFIGRPNNLTYTLLDLDTGEIMKSDKDARELKFTGKSSLIEYLEQNPEFTADYIEYLTKHISNAARGVNLLDEKDLAQIQEQEDSVTHSAINDGELSENSEVENEITQE